jgi:hypothetical protein
MSTALFIGIVDTTSGHTPTSASYLSFLHPSNKITDAMARIVKSFNFFIFFVLILDVTNDAKL